MAKNKGSKLAMLLAAISTLLGLVALLLIFAPAIGVKEQDATYTGLQVAFGYTEKSKLGLELEIFKFSFMNFLPYLLAIVGIVFSVLTVLGKLGKLSPLVAAACYLVAGIFFFCTLAFCVLGDDINSLLGLGSLLAGKDGNAKDFLTLGAGAIVSGILSILAALTSAAALIKK